MEDPKKLQKTNLKTMPQKFHPKTNTSRKHNKLNLKMKLEEVNKFKDRSRPNPNQYCLIAMKSPKSYLIAKQKEGLQLTENGEEMFSGDFPAAEGHNQPNLQDVVYVHHLDCYLIQLDSKIYRKDINGRSCYFFMNLGIKFLKVAFLRYSRLNRRLFIGNDAKSLSIIDLDRKRFDMALGNNLGSKIADYQIFGEKEDKIISLTAGGVIFTNVLNFSLKKVYSRSQIRIELDEEIMEAGSSIA